MSNNFIIKVLITYIVVNHHNIVDSFDAVTIFIIFNSSLHIIIVTVNGDFHYFNIAIILNFMAKSLMLLSQLHSFMDEDNHKRI